MKKQHGMNDVWITRNFNLREFEDPKSGTVRISLILVRKLQAVREIINEPLHVLSGYRTSTWNALLKESHPNSAHLYGWAADVRPASVDLGTVAAAAHFVGIPRIKMYQPIPGKRKGWVHLGYNELPK